MAVVVALALAGACSDALETDTTVGQIVAVANTGSDAVTLVSATHFIGTNLPIGRPFATPASIAARDSFLLTPLGGGDSVAVTHLFAVGGGVMQFVSLKAGAQASAVAVQDAYLSPIPYQEMLLNPAWTQNAGY